MPMPPTMPSAHSLLEHEPFVQAVVRGLMSDEARVQDVVQETWLVALRRPPRADVPMRSWLARVAGNLARASHRNARRCLVALLGLSPMLHQERTSRSSDHLSVRHPERRHRVENLAADPRLHSLCRQPSGRIAGPTMVLYR